MKRALIALLLSLAAQPAHADKVWRVWCPRPGGGDTARQATFDTSAECNKDLVDGALGSETFCHDTPKGPRFGAKYEKLDSWEHLGLPNCAAVKKLWLSCHCEPETVQ
jgi:hypothetical protein